MIGVEEALSLVLERTVPAEPLRVPLAETLGLVLAEQIISDVDSPPHDKSLVDGYAVCAADLASCPVEVVVLEEVTAGGLPTRSVTRGGATRIMTGAPVPDGADAVVMVEDSESLTPSGSRIRLHPRGARVGQHIMVQGTALRRGDIVLRAGHLLRPIEIGLLAEVGATAVLVRRLPSVAVLSTGDELVPCDQQPGAGQIRNSNASLLEALVERAAGVPRNLGIARDRLDELTGAIEQGLEQDVLVVSGGVSAGVLDLVPQVFTQLGVEQVFHKVKLKPGKPLWFGIRAAGPRNQLVFGLPGNPVSSLVCFELFVRPALARLAGRTEQPDPCARASLVREFVHRGERATYHPARLLRTDDGSFLEPLQWKGSADLRTLADANCLAHFPPGDARYPEGALISILRL